MCVCSHLIGQTIYCCWHDRWSHWQKETLKKKKKKSIPDQGILWWWLFAKKSILHPCLLHSAKIRELPKHRLPRHGVSESHHWPSGPWAPNTPGLCWNTWALNTSAKGSQWDKMSVILINVWNDFFFLINFPFLGLYTRRSISGCISLCKEPEKGLDVVGWLWFSCLGEAHHFQYIFPPGGTLQTWKMWRSVTHRENGSTNSNITLKGFGDLADFFPPFFFFFFFFF